MGTHLREENISISVAFRRGEINPGHPGTRTYIFCYHHCCRGTGCQRHQLSEAPAVRGSVEVPQCLAAYRS